MFLFASLGSALPTSGSPDPRGFDAITSSALVLPPAPHFKTGPGHPQSLQVPYVTSTLVLPNDSLVAGNFNAVNPVNPSGAVYDSGTGQLYVADSSSGNVSVINAATGEVVAGIRVGAEPFEMAYDRGKGEIFVTNYGQGTVSVISDRNDTVVATVPVGTEPDGVAYDSATGDVYDANGNSSQNTGGLGNVSVISIRTTPSWQRSLWGRVRQMWPTTTEPAKCGLTTPAQTMSPCFRGATTLWRRTSHCLVAPTASHMTLGGGRCLSRPLSAAKCM